MKAEMELAGGLVFEHGIDVAIARVNVDDYPIAEERFGFTRMPTYKLFSTDAEVGHTKPQADRITSTHPHW